MVLFFKAGWFRWLFGMVFLAALLFLIHRARGTTDPIYAPLWMPEYRNIRLLGWVALGCAADFAFAICLFGLGTLVLPRYFLRWTLTSSARLFARHGLPLTLAAGLMAGFIEEPIFRWEIQPQLVGELGPKEGALIVAALFAAFHWTPLTNCLALWAFGRSLIFSWLFLKSGNPLVPMFARAFGDMAFIGLIARLGQAGLTFLPLSEAPQAEMDAVGGGLK
jgi:membrane protease YdiL (CAAX protease family)